MIHRLLPIFLLAAASCVHASERDVVYVDRSSTAAAAPSTALAFAPPGPQINIPRENRDLAAFVGYEQPTVTTFVIRMDDYQSDNSDSFNNLGFDSFLQRRAITETFGIRFR